MKKFVLPKPDDFGNYFIGKDGPIIFHSGLEKLKGKYFILMNRNDGFLFDKSEIKYFDNAKEALDYLNTLQENLSCV